LRWLVSFGMLDMMHNEGFFWIECVCSVLFVGGCELVDVQNYAIFTTCLTLADHFLSFARALHPDYLQSLFQPERSNQYMNHHNTVEMPHLLASSLKFISSTFHACNNLHGRMFLSSILILTHHLRTRFWPEATNNPLSRASTSSQLSVSRRICADMLNSGFCVFCVRFLDSLHWLP
jgi:hypothetical protein